MEREVSIIKMNIEEYMNMYSSEYEEGNLFDYPIDELEYILNHTDIEKLVLINNRLYELPI